MTDRVPTQWVLVVALDPVNYEKPYTKKLEAVCTVMKQTPPGPGGEKRLTPGYPAVTAAVVNLPSPVICYAHWFSYRATDFRPLMELDPRGFRRLRPGAEGLMKLVIQGFSWTGAPNGTALRDKRVIELIQSDQAGARAAARLFGVARPVVLAAANSAIRGGWNRPALLLLEARQLARGLLAPRAVVRRARFRLVGKRECAIVRVLFDDDRRLPDDREAWLNEVRANHVMYP